MIDDKRIEIVWLDPSPGADQVRAEIGDLIDEARARRLAEEEAKAAALGYTNRRTWSKYLKNNPDERRRR